MIMSSSYKKYVLDLVEDKIRYSLKNRELLWEAMHAAGAIPTYDMRNHDVLKQSGNKRLALVGDSVARSALLSHWYNKSSSRKEATNLASDALSNANLARRARELHLDELIQKHPGASGVATRTPADAMEAIIGAVWQDSGNMETIFAVLQTLGLTSDFEKLPVVGIKREYDPKEPLPEIKLKVKASLPPDAAQPTSGPRMSDPGVGQASTGSMLSSTDSSDSDEPLLLRRLRDPKFKY